MINERKITVARNVFTIPRVSRFGAKSDRVSLIEPWKVPSKKEREPKRGNRLCVPDSKACWIMAALAEKEDHRARFLSFLITERKESK